MLFFKYVMLAGAIVLFTSAVLIICYDLYLLAVYRKRLALSPDQPLPIPRPIRWRQASRIAGLAMVPLLVGLSIVVIPSGSAAVRVSQLSGTRAGTLYPGLHFITPLIDSIATYDVRERSYATGTEPSRKDKEDSSRKADALTVQTREGLPLGLAITVRYRLDARRLDHIHESLPEEIDSEIVRPTVANAFRELSPNYTVRDIFAARREEIRQRAAGVITTKLGADGIQVKEVMLRDIQLPPEYAKGLEAYLLKEQENDQLVIQTEIQAKQVRIAELEAEAQKVQAVRQAEGEAQVKVLEAKGESDAMQYTLPLKEKQIEQTKLEAEARKQSTIKNAEAAAEAKVIDSRAELQRRNLLTDAEANRIRVTAVADAERMRGEAAVLKQSPLLINKIIAERLSDKIQIMMVPTDGKYFFASDVLKGAVQQPMNMAAAEDSDDPPPSPTGQHQ